MHGIDLSAKAYGNPVTVTVLGDLVYLGDCLVFGNRRDGLDGTQLYVKLYPDEATQKRLPTWYVGGDVELTLTFRPTGRGTPCAAIETGRKELADAETF